MIMISLLLVATVRWKCAEETQYFLVGLRLFLAHSLSEDPKKEVCHCTFFSKRWKMEDLDIARIELNGVKKVFDKFVEKVSCNFCRTVPRKIPIYLCNYGGMIICSDCHRGGGERSLLLEDLLLNLPTYCRWEIYLVIKIIFGYFSIFSFSSFELFHQVPKKWMWRIFWQEKYHSPRRNLWG